MFVFTVHTSFFISDDAVSGCRVAHDEKEKLLQSKLNGRIWDEVCVENRIRNSDFHWMIPSAVYLPEFPLKIEKCRMKKISSSKFLLSILLQYDRTAKLIRKHKTQK